LPAFTGRILLFSIRRFTPVFFLWFIFGHNDTIKAQVSTIVHFSSYHGGVKLSRIFSTFSLIFFRFYASFRPFSAV
ncbi:MAG: hypothetical protein SPF91_03150, partial [Clostridium sp.]|nr:hypothetical protein [Clostridium sp.]